jgi:hypothetical protein
MRGSYQALELYRVSWLCPLHWLTSTMNRTSTKEL